MAEDSHSNHFVHIQRRTNDPNGKQKGDVTSVATEARPQFRWTHMRSGLRLADASGQELPQTVPSQLPGIAVLDAMLQRRQVCG